MFIFLFFSIGSKKGSVLVRQLNMHMVVIAII